LIAEILIYNRSISTVERQRCEGYLAWKWGLQQQLPWNHPYAVSFPGYGSQTVVTDSDARAYLTAVASADGGTGVEVCVARAIDDFVIQCKSAGIWNAINASCILCGARTLSGALVPLAGAAPTNNNFVAGDYNRKTGLIGNGSSKYLNTNRAGNADQQNSFHAAIYGSSLDTGSGATVRVWLASGAAGSVKNAGLFHYSGSYFFNNRRSSVGNTTWTTAADTSGFVGTSREDSASVVGRAKSTNNSFSVASVAPSVDSYGVYAGRTDGTTADYSAARLAFYSIGSSIDLATLDARVSALITAIQAAIP
jgi:hypothetical protein